MTEKLAKSKSNKAMKFSKVTKGSIKVSKPEQSPLDNNQIEMSQSSEEKDNVKAPAIFFEEEIIDLEDLEDIEFLLDEIEDQIAPLAL